MRGQPVRQRLGVAAFEEAERYAGLAVDDDRAVVLAAPDGEVVDLSGVRTKFLHALAGSDVADASVTWSGADAVLVQQAA